jgi:hypothetical protein
MFKIDIYRKGRILIRDKTDSKILKIGSSLPAKIGKLSASKRIGKKYKSTTSGRAQIDYIFYHKIVKINLTSYK